MVVDTISDFLVSNIYRKKFLSIDYGTKYIGTAISDQTNIISIPYRTLDKKSLMGEIIEILEKENIHGIIIGMPYHLDGSESEMSKQVRKFALELSEVIKNPILLLDERLSSKGYKSEKKDHSTSVHEKSACLILDDFLSLYKNSPSGI
jgi:putative Holliday junction resolvase